MLPSRFYSLLTLLSFVLVTACSGCDEDPGTTPGDGDGNAISDGDGTSGDSESDGDSDGVDGDSDHDGAGDSTSPESCNPVTDEDCPCRAGQFRICSSAGDPSSFPSTSACIAGFQRCVGGEWEEECHGEFAPDEVDCTAPTASVESCDGFINQFGDCVQGPRGEPADPNVYCADGVASGGIGDPCSCEVPEGGEEFLRKQSPCYTGPAGTLGVGTCRGGVRDCQPDGSWGPCVGEVLPLEEEICGDGRDNTCSGIVDDGCEYCPPGVTNCEAYSSGYLDEPCPDGSARNACGGCYEPEPLEVCGNGLDSNCSGIADEGCPCTGTSQLCYPGPADKAGIGQCSFGIQYCQGEFWGPCTGYVLPTAELCGPDGTGNGQDNNCSGIVDEGCGCADGDTRPCGSDVGQCEMGVQTCQNGAWGTCEGAIGPQPEVCDGQDNNCNGIVDEGLRNACGQCEGPCYTHPAPIEIDDFFEEGLEFSSATDEDNPTGKDGVTLTQSSVFPNYLWAANSVAGRTVSKVDTDTGLEVGRYWVGENPSRTAVDLDGNMWVVGRNDGRVTKVLWNTNDCPGTNTSVREADGTVTVVNNAQNPLADDCVVYSDTPGSQYNYNSGRGMAVDSNGMIWVGYSDNEGAIQRINPNDFNDISVPSAPHDIQVYQADANGNVSSVPGVTGSAGRIYGLVADSQGYLYAADLWDSDGLPRFNTATGQWDMFIRGFDCAIYGIAVDGSDRIWMGCGEPSWAETHSPTGDGIAMFDPSTMQIYRFHVPSQFNGQLPAKGTTTTVQTSCVPNCGGWQTTALAVDPNTGDIWVTARSNGYLLRLTFDEMNPANSTWTFVPVLRNDNGNWRPEVSSGGDMRGVGFDRLGYLWHLGLATRYIYKVDPSTLDFMGAFDIGTHGHYTYSDFTGSTAFNFTAPRGIFRYVFESAFPITRVDEIFVEATIPPGTTLGVRIRPLDSDGTPISDWYPVGAPGTSSYFEYPVGQEDHLFDLHSELGFPVEGTHFEVEIRMTRSDNDIRPFLHDLQLNWHYP